MTRLLPIALAAIALSGCASSTSATEIAATEVALTAAEKAATIYARLPQCPAAPVCSEASVIGAIKAADTVAYGAVLAAQKSGLDADVTLASASVAALVLLIPAN
jgi:hypothetical protein